MTTKHTEYPGAPRPRARRFMAGSAMLVILAGAGAGMSQTLATSSAPCTAPADEPPRPVRIDNTYVSMHELTLPGRTLRYRATAGTMPMKDEAGKLKATVFFVAYELLTGTEPVATRPADIAATRPASVVADRPITFVFNGGPGAAAVWLHLGTAGPRRIRLDETGSPPVPPFRLEDNAHTWLPATDLVFIDPVGTGFSRPAEGEKPEQFYGVRQDISWMADFIRLYITQYQRWPSPKFVAGESYGTTRAGGLSSYLLDRYGIALNGVIMVSTVLDFQTILAQGGNDLPYALFLPSYAAVAWYHGRLAPGLRKDLKSLLAEVERWTLDTYVSALARGAGLSSAEQDRIAAQLSGYTGLPADLIRRYNLRIPPGAFQKRLLEDTRQIVGRFDGRILGFDPEPTRSWPGYDPSLSGFFAAYSSTFNDMIRRDLGYESVLPYEVLSDKVHPWKYGEAGQGFLSVADDLRTAMIKNPGLHVHFASGYYDLATPYFATVYTVDHLDLEPRLREHISLSFYESGHMMYHHRRSLAELGDAVTRFIRTATGLSSAP